MLDFIGTIAVTAIMVVAVNAVISALDVSRAQRIAAALAVGLWIGLAAASASAGLFTVSSPFPVIGFYLAAPLMAVAALAYLSPVWRTALLGLPLPLLVGLNLSRVVGVFFLLLAVAGRLSGPFPTFAGWGDIAVGALALPALLIALRPRQGGRSFLAAWNGLGALDLVVAVMLGVASAQGSPLQLFDAGAGSAAVQVLPWAIIPGVLVPFYLTVHAIIFAQLRFGESKRRPGRVASGIA
ncbi:MAG: hypothetical protein ACREMQ_12690 [Longimicrobiales bacterium]